MNTPLLNDSPLSPAARGRVPERGPSPARTRGRGGLRLPLRPFSPAQRGRWAASARSRGGLIFLLLALLLLPSLTSAQEAPFFPVGIHIRSLSELAKLGPEIKAAGFNCVLADGPLGASMIPGLWQAHALGLRVYLSTDALDLAASSDPDTVRDNVQKLYDVSSWTRGNPAYAGMWLRVEGLRPEQAEAYWWSSAAGNAAGAPRSSEMLVLLPTESLESQERLTQTAQTAASTDGLFFPTAEGAASLALEAAVRAALVGPQFEASASPPLPGPSRAEVFASEASSPLLWTLQRYGEVNPIGLAPYRTPDASTGYTVTAQPLLDLPIPNRSALVDAKQLTRFSMRAFNSVDGQGVLLARSTAGEVSYVRMPMQGGWHVYQLDLSQATWESRQAEGLKWGGSSGTIQDLSLVPVPQLKAQIAFDWIRLEPPSTGEVVWPLQQVGEIAKTEGLEGVKVGQGELKGRATADQVSVEMSLPAAGLTVNHLPFLSFLAGVPGAGEAEVTIWPTKDGPSSTAKLTWDRAQDAQCFDLRNACFLGGFGVYWEALPSPLTRLRLTLPATAGQEFKLSGVRLGPNYDLRAAPSEALPPQAAAPEPAGPNP
jgi:hypothetical protein